MQRFLAATDFSLRSQRALQRAALLARTNGGEVTLLHVVDDDQPKQIVETEMREAANFLRQQKDFLPDLRDIRSTVEVVSGDPFDAILRTARSISADLIVMGTHRKQLLRDVLVGTTIERVVRTGPFPVLMVNGQADRPYASVLAPVDMSDASANALKTADALGFLDGVDVTVPHAFLAAAKGKMYIGDATKEQIATYVREEEQRFDSEVAAFLAANGFSDRRWQHHIREGEAFEIIAGAVQALRPDLVVIGTRGSSGIAKLFLGSVTEAVLRSVETDILAIPPTRQNPT